MKILITGSAGFIGYHLVKKLIQKKIYVIGIDSLNNYYDLKLKKDRLKDINKIKSKYYNFYRIDISNKKKLSALFKKYKFDVVVNLAAQAGVRYSIINPEAYLKNNLVGFFNILEMSKLYKIKHLLSASSSSVYGNSKKFPLEERFNTSFPIQFYAATKKSNEVMAHSYSHLFKIPITMLRFFTVYGPFGRPDMAPFLFTKKIYENKIIQVFNKGNHSRDFTYIDDIIHGLELAIKNTPRNFKNLNAPYRILNLGRGKKIKLMNFIKEIEKNLNQKAKIKYLKIQKGDIKDTLSSIKKTKIELNYKPKTSIESGIKIFVDWFKDYYKK